MSALTNKKTPPPVGRVRLGPFLEPPVPAGSEVNAEMQT